MLVFDDIRLVLRGILGPDQFLPRHRLRCHVLEQGLGRTKGGQSLKVSLNWRLNRRDIAVLIVIRDKDSDNSLPPLIVATPFDNPALGTLSEYSFVSSCVVSAVSPAIAKQQIRFVGAA